MKRFGTVLVANRGEIAVRILRAAKAAGYGTVAVYSDADREALHVRLADRAVRIGPAAPSASYLSVEAILAAARAAGAEAIHPGYGFLSERAHFARAVTEAGLVFVGPPADAIDAMGDKSAAKARMLAAGVPCIPGFHGRSAEEQTAERLAAEARAIGFPVMIKAAAGGGGRGMRLVTDDAALLPALASARAEATNAFGDGTLLLERALTAARHVEIQVFGDVHGSIVHLGERDCSIQRRHQKVVEEAPSPAVDAELRAAMGAAAVKAARAVGYVGAGTVELMLAGREFFFLEMNTRLQVEHPVTELVYGVDLVAWQLAVAQGEALPLDQAALDARRRGHAIEVRLCAEDAAFRPHTGVVRSYRAPGAGAWAPVPPREVAGTFVRVDSGITDGSVVSASYDSLLAKIVVHGPDRESARRRLVTALGDTSVLGVATNRDLLRAIVETEAFASGAFDTGFFAAGHVPWLALPPAHVALAAIALELDDGARLAAATGVPEALLGFSSCALAATPFVLALEGDGADTGGTGIALRVARGADGFTVAGAGDVPPIAARLVGPGEIAFVLGGVEQRARYTREGDVLWLDALGRTAAWRDRTYAPPLRDEAAAALTLVARSDGRVLRVLAAPGDTVVKGQVLVVVESMKMELELAAGAEGTVKAVHVAAGEQVGARKLLVELAGG